MSGCVNIYTMAIVDTHAVGQSLVPLYKNLGLSGSNNIWRENDRNKTNSTSKKLGIGIKETIRI